MSNTLPAHVARPAVAGPNELRRSALGRASLAAATALLLGLVLTYILTLHSGAVTPQRTDFIAYYSGGKLVLTGHGAALYDFSRLAATERHVVYPDRLRYGVLPYVYPPYLALALAPIAALPYSAAYLLWFLLNLATLGVVVAMLQRYLGLRGPRALPLWLACAAFVPVFVSLVQGQTSIFLLGLLAAAFFAYRAGHQLPAGVALAFVLIKPPYVALLLLVFLVQKQWRALGAFAVTALCLLAGPAVVLGWAVDRDYVHVLALAGTWHNQFGYAPQWSNSLEGFTQLLLPHQLALPVTLLLDIGVMAAVLVAARSRPSPDLTFGLAMVGALLISPHVLDHDLILLLIPAAAALRLNDNRVPYLLPVLAVGYLTVTVGLGLAPLIHIQPAVVAMAALAVWLYAASRNQSQRRTSLAG